MKSSEIRQRFFNYFIKYGHEQVSSSSLIPAQDPTLLFTNAGMNQFKDLFLGQEKRSYTRAVSIQKCVRAGGKHNDLDNVGFTKRHLTFFEMMGNFSFGDYFKKEAIQFAWEFLTKELQLPMTHLHATVFETDDEAYDIWHKDMGLPTTMIHRLDAKDNFWQMGDIGPCGPCTEIHLDRGPEYGCTDVTTCGPSCDCDRFLEIWNLVFMQFDRQADGSLKPLKQTGVDTGMGLERLATVMQNTDSVFTTDLFTNIIKKIEDLTGLIYAQESALIKAAFHVIADHIRSSTMLIADGCAPSNEGRGYVLRKLIRRAALFTQKLTDKNIFPTLSRIVIADMATVYPELKEQTELVLSVLTSETEKFSANLTRGRVILAQYLQESSKTKQLTGQQAFKLYDTYGFPIELVGAVAREQGYTVDTESFETEMAAQQAQSGKKTTDLLTTLELGPDIQSEFTGYHELETHSTIVGLVYDNKLVDRVAQGQTCYVITRKSPFFIVGGGQVPDQGRLVLNGVKTPLLSVRFINTAIAAEIKAPHALAVGDSVTAHVDPTWRTNAMKNHTATHLLQAALMAVCGKQIKQSGSLVHPDYLRFDFTYHENLTSAQITQVEDLVNEKIRADICVDVQYMPLTKALEQGALAFFGDKYKPEQVRMIGIEEFSKELCGGTHARTTGAIGTFKIIEVTALSAGHRRIVAVTGPRAMALFQEIFNTTKALCQEFKVQREDIVGAIAKQREEIKELHAHIKKVRSQLMHAQLHSWQQQIEVVNGVPFLLISVEDGTVQELRDIAHTLNQKQPGLYMVVSATADGKSLFVATLDERYTTAIDMQKFGAWLKDSHGLKGGVNKNAIQGGGGTINANLKQAIKDWIAGQ
jgi:alanyl-tRNA synthetase